ncbi:MAG: aminopeptidase [Gammaproteobacteria bacterium]|nr:aminopeptidase [Gammaproteobacteria bacterium]
MLGIALLLVALGGCQAIGYYTQAVTGQLSLLIKRRPIEVVMEDPATPSAVRERLALAQDIRAFAEGELGLPVGDTYSSYVDLGREFVVWNVFVAPEFSVELESWCFPSPGASPIAVTFHEMAR